VTAPPHWRSAHGNTRWDGMTEERAAARYARRWPNAWRREGRSVNRLLKTMRYE